MIDHIGVSVRDYDKSKQFYLAALAPLGYQLVRRIATVLCGRVRQGNQDILKLTTGFNPIQITNYLWAACLTRTLITLAERVDFVRSVHTLSLEKRD